MQLDQTRIAIRERDYADLLDLALLVLRRHAAVVMLSVVMAALPLMLLNHWLLADWVTDADLVEIPLTVYAPYAMMLALLVAFEVPLATAPATLFLGQSMFVGRPHWRRLLVDLLRSLPQLLVLQLAIRGLMFLPVLTLVVPYSIWPYLNEVILLERNPLVGRRGRRSSTQRAWTFHSRHVGDSFGRLMLGTVVAALLVLSVWVSLVAAAAVLTNQWDINHPAVYTVWLPLAMWCVAGYFTVVRFLAYLDMRIRDEGWEIELKMRAEGARLAKQVV